MVESKPGGNGNIGFDLAANAADTRTSGEFFCFVDRIGEAGVEQMAVWIEVVARDANPDAVKADLRQRLKEALGVEVVVTPKPRGALDAHTATSQTSKVKRVLDRRRNP